MDYFKKAKSQTKVAMKEAQGLAQHFQAPYQQPPAWNQNSAPYSHQQPQLPGQPHHYHAPVNQYNNGGYYPPQPAHGMSYHAPPAQQPHYAPPAQQPQHATPVQQPQYATTVQHPQYAPPHAVPFDMNSLYQALPAGQNPPVLSNQPGHSQPPTAPHASRPVEHPPREIQKGTQEQMSQYPLKPKSTWCPQHEPAPCELVGFYVLTPQVKASAALDVAEFSICSACFVGYVAPYPYLSAGFTAKDPEKPTYKDAPSASLRSMTCDFALPTVQTLIYRQCLAEQSYNPVLRFVKSQSSMTECNGDNLQPGEHYFVRRTKDFAACLRCYERYLRGTAFDGEVERRPIHSEWQCDIGMRGYTFRVLVAELSSPQPDIRRFVAQVDHKAVLECCPGDGVALAQPGERCFVYEAIEGKPGVFCQACFFDHIKDTAMERHFNVYNELEEQYKGELTCDLSTGTSKFAMRCAIRLQDDEIWRKATSGRCSLPPCKGLEGVDEEDLGAQDPDTSQWYCVTAHPKVEICKTCYVTTVELLGAAHLFSAINRPLVPGVVRMCYLATSQNLYADRLSPRNFENTLVWRGAIIRDWLHHGYDSLGNFSAFQHVAAAMATWPTPCASDTRLMKAASGKRWYRNHYLAEGDDHKTGITCCEECFVSYIKGSPLEWFVGVDKTERVNEQNPAGFACNLYTDRIRQVMLEACESDDFHIFARYWAKRKEIEAKRKAIGELCQQQAERQAADLMMTNAQANSAAYTNLMGQLAANTNATIMGIGGSVAEAAAPDYGQRFGNSAVGYGYLTHNGASAAEASLDAQKLGRQPGTRIQDYRPSGNTWQDTQTLLQLSKSIEAEWAAIR